MDTHPPHWLISGYLHQPLGSHPHAVYRNTHTPTLHKGYHLARRSPCLGQLTYLLRDNNTWHTLHLLSMLGLCSHTWLNDWQYGLLVLSMYHALPPCRRCRLLAVSYPLSLYSTLALAYFRSPTVSVSCLLWVCYSCVPLHHPYNVQNTINCHYPH